MCLQIIMTLDNDSQHHQELFQGILQNTGISSEHMAQLMQGFQQKLDFGQALMSRLSSLQQELQSVITKCTEFNFSLYRQAIVLKIKG